MFKVCRPGDVKPDIYVVMLKSDSYFFSLYKVYVVLKQMINVHVGYNCTCFVVGRLAVWEQILEVH